MGNTLPTVWAPAAADVSECATTQRDAGSTISTAEHGSVIIQPRIKDVHVEGNINMNVSNTYVQAPAMTDGTNVISPKAK
ncbi:NACHT%2C LRR and PYD domains-containing protein 12-like isoform X4, partial [Scomber scombrus]